MRFNLIILIAFFSASQLWAQSNPSPQNLPYAQDFSSLSHSATSYPTGWQGWSVGTAPGLSYSSAAPIADRSLLASSAASTSSGNVHNYNGKIGFLNIGTLDLGIVLAINTSGKKNIRVSYDAMTIRNPYDSSGNTRFNELSLQYRIGTSGSFTTLSGIEYQNNDIRQNGAGITTPQNVQSKTIILPPVCDSIPNLQLRWVSRQISGSGLRPSFAIDNIQIDTAATIAIKKLADALEGTSATIGNFEFNIAPTTASVTTFSYSLSGTATFNTDYTVSLSAGATPIALTASSGTITVPVGKSSFTASISPINDALAEGMEFVRMSLSGASGAYATIDSVATLNIIDDENTLIHQIQGAGPTASKGTYRIEGIVTGIFPLLSPSGFYVQEEDSDADSDPKTSEAIFIASSAALSIGDKVNILGTTEESAAYPSFDQATITPININILSTGMSLPKATVISLPRIAGTDYESYEAMLVRFSDTLTVTDNANLGTYGELVLSAGGLVYQASQLVDPNDASASGTTASGTANLAAINAHLLQNDLRSILLDDGRSTLPSLPFVNSDNTLCIGSTIDSLGGIMGYGFGSYRLQPIALSAVKINHQARPSLPDVGKDATIKVASFNVLSYFNGDGLGGGFPTSRGANSLTEFSRQREKIISTISQINPDVMGLIEIENDGTGTNSALQNLVNGINALMGAGTYSFIYDGDTIQDYGTDDIRCAIIYKSAVLDTVGKVMISSDTLFNRPPLAQTFKVKATDSTFNFIINHFKSKSCTGSTGLDNDKSDGQGCFNYRRKSQAAALIQFINNVVMPTSGTNKVLSMGDYNSYFEEDPLDTMRSKDFTILNTAKEYSYCFGGQLGSLDYAIISKGLLPNITGIAKWNINSIEPTFLNYEDSINDGGGDAVNRWAECYTASPFRSSDHDPVIVGLSLGNKLGISYSESKAALILYPNPAQDQLRINYNIASDADIILLNYLGQTVLQKKLLNNALSTVIDIEHLIAGTYLLKMVTKDGTTMVQRFQKW
ncbi:MAG: ExeM/NucH family extracellular endonuclease [Phycisphaerales bacterium]|nr:ExeM/NucH family extracellular endonuclease [Phycisphaerales bacterium]